MFKSIYVFDAYGTLFDVNSAARNASAEPDHAALAAKWPEVSANWRRNCSKGRGSDAVRAEINSTNRPEICSNTAVIICALSLK